ncbi:hypothetical protein DKX38_012663 [Salix brachista]|uniref:Uncharacterized protein n=1 Tax=Salix brachista TaxID=2182728 RepID=A0A5N5LR37_9ROSI|nr:hypothetical protein DKX38_012663 [Salix brachista]
MICYYEIQGDGRGSLSIFGDILKAELKPNEEIFTSILSASSHTGTAGRGRMAARAGRLGKSWASFRKCQFNQMRSTLFGAFLHGCGLHSRFDLGDVAIKRMLELQTGEACYCVLTCMLQMEDGIRLSRYGS